MDVVKDDMKVGGAMEEDAEERVGRRHVIGCSGVLQGNSLDGKGPRKLGEALVGIFSQTTKLKPSVQSLHPLLCKLTGGP